MPEEKVIAEVVDAAGVERTLSRLAFEILERNKGAENLVLVGLHTRGVPIAERIAEKIREIEGIDVPLGTLDATFYRDDVGHSRKQMSLRTTDIPVDITGKVVVLIDDVLYTGRTVRSALDALIDFGRPERIELAVLVDRGHRQLPIKADYIGKNLPTSLGEEVAVKLKNVDGEDRICLIARKNKAD